MILLDSIGKFRLGDFGEMEPKFLRLGGGSGMVITIPILFWVKIFLCSLSVALFNSFKEGNQTCASHSQSLTVGSSFSFIPPQKNFPSGVRYSISKKASKIGRVVFSSWFHK